MIHGTQWASDLISHAEYLLKIIQDTFESSFMNKYEKCTCYAIVDY